MSHFYVICPVKTDPLFIQKRDALTDIGKRYGLVPFMPLEHRPEFRLNKMLEDLQEAKFAIVDLSLERPSCYFELGIVITTGIDVLIIAASDTYIHQVGDDRRVSKYANMNEYSEIISEYIVSKRS